MGHDLTIRLGAGDGFEVGKTRQELQLLQACSDMSLSVSGLLALVFYCSSTKQFSW